MHTHRQLIALTTAGRFDSGPYLSMLASHCANSAISVANISPVAPWAGGTTAAAGVAVQAVPQSVSPPGGLTFIETQPKHSFARLLSLSTGDEVDGIIVPEAAGASLACRLVHQAACSIWWLPDGARPRLNRVLAPVDFSVRAADSLRVATGICSLSQGQCLALNVYLDDAVLIAADRRRQFQRNITREYHAFMKPIDCLGVSVQPLFMEAGNVARAIATTAEEQDADLIVIGTRGRGRVGGFLRPSLAARLIRVSRVPVLVVKHFGAKLGLFASLQASDDPGRGFARCN
jgi:nucleotide-binding universal stress UspA family protein